jgi:hypothetical protein
MCAGATGKVQALEVPWQIYPMVGWSSPQMSILAKILAMFAKMLVKPHDPSSD